MAPRSEERIRELEAQVAALQQRLANVQDAGAVAGDAPETGELDAQPSMALSTSAEERGSESATEEADEAAPLEARIGGVWLSRVAVVLIMTGIVLTATRNIGGDGLGAVQRVLAGYTLALAAVAYGLWPRAQHSILAKTVLGAGLAGLYYTTYAMFFDEGLRLFQPGPAAIPGLLVCLAIITAIAHWRGSRAAAGVAIFLAYYTVLLSATGSQSALTYAYALATCAVLTFAALLFHATHRWMSFTWITLLATYALFGWFLRQPAILQTVPSHVQFWLSNGFLILCFLAFSAALVIDARKPGGHAATAAPLAALNTALYLAFTWQALHQYGYREFEWLFRLGLAAALGLFALLAETSGPRRNYLAQTFLALSVLLFTLALEALLTRGQLVVALALECFALAVAYRATGRVVFKVLNMVLLAVTVVAGMAAMRLPGHWSVGAYSLPANWAACLGAALAMAAAAWYYERYVRRPAPEHRRLSGQWFYVDTVLDVRPVTAATLHAAAAALLVMMVTVLNVPEGSMLPFALGGLALVFGTLAALSRTPQLWVGSVMLLVSAHLCFYFYVLFYDAAVLARPWFDRYALALAAITALAGHFWARYIDRPAEKSNFEQILLTGLPYLGAAVLVCTLTALRTPAEYAAPAHHGLAVGIVLLGAVSGRALALPAALGAFAFGAAVFLRGLSAADSLSGHPYFLVLLAAVTVSYVAGERGTWLAERRAIRPHGDDLVRSVLVAAAGALGMLGLYAWANPEYLTLVWMALGLGAMGLGVLFRESRYRWAALLVLAVCAGRVFSYDLARMPRPWQLGVAVAVGAALLVVSWLYSRGWGWFRLAATPTAVNLTAASVSAGALHKGAPDRKAPAAQPGPTACRGGSTSIPPRRAAAEHICKRLTEAGHRALLAGGCVRDLILGVEPQDYDIATSARPEEIARLFERTISVGAAFGVQVVVLPEGHFEVATFRKDGPYLDGRHPAEVTFTSEKEDALRRDFTINALFYDPITQQVLDYADGRADIERKVVRTVGNPLERFREDHLRLLRAVRFAARLEYTIDPTAAQAIRELAPLIKKTSPERVRDELLKILTEGRPAKALRMMDEFGLLEQVLPEAARMKNVAQPPEFHPEGDVFDHTLLMLEHLDAPTPMLALGALLHDVGKPETQTHDDRIRFNNHDKVGAEIARRICRRLHLSNAATDRVVWLVGQHMRLAMAPKMRASKLKRLVRDPAFPELLALCRADCMASHRDTSVIDWLAGYAAELKPEEARPAPLLTGNDLIHMGYAPGPVFGTILRAVEDEQLEGRIATKLEAQTWVRKHWPCNQASGQTADAGG